MTERIKDDTMDNTAMDDVENVGMDARVRRRSLLKAGAVIAPLALTLHGGSAMAFIGSTGCVDDLVAHVNIPHFDDHGQLDGEETFDPDTGFTGRLNENGTNETHWDYLSNEGLPGVSCMQSMAGV